MFFLIDVYFLSWNRIWFLLTWTPDGVSNLRSTLHRPVNRNTKYILKDQKADSESSSSEQVLSDGFLIVADCFLNIYFDFLIIKI